jgi:Fic-DOC domain mobile mystery protein B
LVAGDFTELSDDERTGLRLKSVRTRADLNRAESRNIADAVTYVYQSRLRANVIVSESWLRQLHKRMYGDVWSWAGKYRTSDKNLGVPKHEVVSSLAQHIDNASFWLANAVYSPDELAIRFGHRLVWIHPFPNGNGRWHRLASDALIMSLGGPRFTWGGAGELTEQSSVREQYLRAIRRADDHDFSELLAFVRQG